MEHIIGKIDLYEDGWWIRVFDRDEVTIVDEKIENCESIEDAIAQAKSLGLIANSVGYRHDGGSYKESYDLLA